MGGFGVPRPRRTSQEEQPGDTSRSPRRAGTGTGVRTAVFGSHPSQAAQIRDWCRRGVRLPAQRAFPVLLVAGELVANAWRHTASGNRYGRVKLQLRHLPDRVVYLAVTDDGPRPGRPAGLPRLTPPTDDLRVGGRGLHLVERLSLRWGWDGEIGAPLTVWAHIDPYAPPPAAT